MDWEQKQAIKHLDKAFHSMKAAEAFMTKDQTSTSVEITLQIMALMKQVRS